MNWSDWQRPYADPTLGRDRTEADVGSRQRALREQHPLNNGDYFRQRPVERSSKHSKHRAWNRLNVTTGQIAGEWTAQWAT
jgi:hypothetical protein